MMELVPEKVDSAVLFSLAKPCREHCAYCGDLAISIHNLMMASNLRYVIIDLQDEKHVCESFTEEVLQLWKRLRVPFLFAGVMPSVEKVLEGHGYLKQYSLYPSGEEAIAELKKDRSDLFSQPLENIEFGSPLVTQRSRALAAGEDAEDSEDEDE